MSFAPVQGSGAPTESLAGLVERVTFHNEENGFCVLRLKARGQRDLITVIGHAAMISAGEWFQAAGTWTNDRTHGLQFRAAFLKATPPTTIEGIERYLGSGMIRGIGPAYAKRLVKTFGETVFEVIEAEPARLREVEGIGLKRAERIGAELLEVTADRLTAALAFELQEGAVVADTVGERRCIFLAGLYRAERDIAERLQSLVGREPPWPALDIDKAVPWLEQRGSLTLAPSSAPGYYHTFDGLSPHRFSAMRWTGRSGLRPSHGPQRLFQLPRAR